MTDKQNFQAVVNCASELPVASFMFPKVVQLAGHDLPMSAMLRRVADHIEINNLDGEGHSVQVVRVPNASVISDTVIDLTATPVFGEAEVKDLVSATRVQTGTENEAQKEITSGAHTLNVATNSDAQCQYDAAIEKHLLAYLRSEGLAGSDDKLAATPMGSREELMRNWLTAHGLAHVLDAGN
jgi:hypothetical protein